MSYSANDFMDDVLTAAVEAKIIPECPDCDDPSPCADVLMDGMQRLALDHTDAAAALGALLSMMDNGAPSRAAEIATWTNARAVFDRIKPRPLATAERATPEEIARARAEYQREGEIEIDDDAKVSRAEGNPDCGCFVQAWVWLPDEDEGGAA